MTKKSDKLKKRTTTTNTSDNTSTVNENLIEKDKKQDLRKPTQVSNQHNQDNQESTGKTLDGKIFKVPQTHDFVNTLFSPSTHRSLFEYIVIFMMLFQCILFFIFRLNKTFFLCSFLFWRTCYNFGLGLLLKSQSKYKTIVNWAKRNGFGHTETPAKRRWWVQLLIEQITLKMGPGYQYEKQPLEFNAWMLFRGLVDLILLNDFVAYVLFSCSYFVYPPNGITLLDILRYTGGVFLIAFNVWVKMDAHRVVKDFAWYWGDFFFLIEASLTFDGVFEMAPHPMYSVGYIGFYGTSLIANSYTVLFVSLIAHAAQFGFLYTVENPHIDKTYNIIGPGKHDDTREILQLYFRRDLIVFKNFDWLRSSDMFSVVIAFYSIVMALILGPADNTFALTCYVGHAVFWRLIHTYGLGIILHYQSNTKFWTKHFIKHGDSSREAFHHWKVLYNLTLSMTYISFFICAVRLYYIPEDWTYGGILLRHTLGVLLIILHAWSALSVYEVLGDFGWFYGDFFISELRNRRGLYYTGIYRFLNNPEKIMGHASFWGLTMICNSPVLFCITMIGQISTWLFLTYVEAPHMQKIYGSQIRPQAGAQRVLQEKVIENLKEILPSPRKKKKKMVTSGMLKQTVKKWESEEALHKKYDDYPDTIISSTAASDLEMSSQYETEEGEEVKTDKSVNRVKSFSDAVEKSRQVVEEIVTEVEKAVNTAIPDIQTLVEKVAVVTRIDEDDISKIKKELFKLSVAKSSFELGESITIEFVAPKEFMRSNDWVGIYPIDANSSNTMTVVKSDGLWKYVRDSKIREDTPVSSSTPDLIKFQVAIQNSVEFEDNRAQMVKSSLIFAGDLLPWKTGAYEARYHHDDKYHVLCFTPTFSVTLDYTSVDTLLPDISNTKEYLLTMIKKAMMVNENTKVELFENGDIFDSILACSGPLDKPSFEKRKKVVSKRIVHIIKNKYGIDFDWQVVEQARSIVSLFDKINEGKKALSL